VKARELALQLGAVMPLVIALVNTGPFVEDTPSMCTDMASGKPGTSRKKIGWVNTFTVPLDLVTWART
jgi:hypothetical protein